MREASWSLVPSAKCGLSKVGPCPHNNLRAPPPPRLVGLYSNRACARATPAKSSIRLASGAVRPKPSILATKLRRDSFPAFTFASRRRNCCSSMAASPPASAHRPAARPRAISSPPGGLMLSEPQLRENRVFRRSVLPPRPLAGRTLVRRGGLPRALQPRQAHGAVDERQVRERLGEIADQALCAQIVFLAEQAHVVGPRDEPLEHALGLLDASGERIGVDQPEAARQECTLARRQPVLGRAGVVAQHQTIDQELALDRRDRAAHARVLRGQETERGNQQQARIEIAGAVALHETAEVLVETVAADVRVNLGAQGAPAIDRAFEPKAFRALDRAIECDPGHDLRIGELLAARAHLPDALVGLAPDLFQMLEQFLLQFPAGTGRAEAAEARMVQRVDAFAVNVELP